MEALSPLMSIDTEFMREGMANHRNAMESLKSHGLEIRDPMLEVIEFEKTLKWAHNMWPGTNQYQISVDHVQGSGPVVQSIADWTPSIK